MPQTILPLIPYGASKITNFVSVLRDDERWTYFLGIHPIYFHKAQDLRMFRMVTAQLIDSGACRQVDVIKTFGVSKSSVIRSLKKLREGGAEAFFQQRRGHRGATVLTPEVLEKAQGLLNQSCSRYEAAEQLGIEKQTLRKAINQGRLLEAKPCSSATAKSTRDLVDAASAGGLGTACTRVAERVLAAFGVLDAAPVRFEASLDVPKAGVLCALPALLANGLLEGAEELLGEIKGYYTTVQVLLLLAFMALCRIKSVEKLRGHAPGEFGKLLGLDRVPEVRCLRNKMDDMSEGDAAELWSAHLSRHWMDAENEGVGTLYVDGHVRIYHGGLTKPPRRYVSRERLCLRGTTDYWVNDAIGRPFFVVNKAIDPGLLKTLREDIVPRLLRDIPNQPTEKDLLDKPYLCRFVLVFDREGYSPKFFREMWQKHRIGCITYKKYPDEPWQAEWFCKHKVIMPNGEVVEMSLAEMGTRLGSGKEVIWMREVRKLTDSGHQTSLVSTAYELPHTQLAAQMFSRWCQENFFRYMMQHFAIDLLEQYGVEQFPDTEQVVNPAWRELSRTCNSLQNQLRYRRARFAEITIHPEAEDDSVRYYKWVKKKAELLEQIEQFENQLAKLKKKLKETPKHIDWADLEEKDKFHRLLPVRKRLMDTIRMIAYRAETAMAGALTGPTLDLSTVRKLLQNLFVGEADILPDPEKKLVRVRVHGASTPAANRALGNLINQLNKAQVKYPGTDMCFFYELQALVPCA